MGGIWDLSFSFLLLFFLSSLLASFWRACSAPHSLSPVFRICRSTCANESVKNEKKEAWPKAWPAGQPPFFSKGQKLQQPFPRVAEGSFLSSTRRLVLSAALSERVSVWGNNMSQPERKRGMKTNIPVF
jgi:hypothetical protein